MSERVDVCRVCTSYLDQGIAGGECHFMPSQLHGAFPDTKETDWCRQFERDDEKVALFQEKERLREEALNQETCLECEAMGEAVCRIHGEIDYSEAPVTVTANDDVTTDTQITDTVIAAEQAPALAGAEESVPDGSENTGSPIEGTEGADIFDEEVLATEPGIMEGPADMEDEPSSWAPEGNDIDEDDDDDEGDEDINDYCQICENFVEECICLDEEE